MTHRPPPRQFDAYLLGNKVETAERVEFITYLAPQFLNLFVVLLELDVAWIDGLSTRRGCLVFVLVYLSERLGRLRILKLEVPRCQERCGLVCSNTNGRVEVSLSSQSLCI